jgi:FkbM family methyltransferase
MLDTDPRKLPILLFHYNGFVLEYKPINYYGLVENYLLDIYHTSMLKPDDIVVDLGASIGDFAIKAMRRAKYVIAVEPNKEDFQLLRRNLQANGCHNVVPLDVGVASNAGMRQITFQNRTYSFRVKTLAEMLEEQNISRVDFIKMDIEGYETEVIESSIDIIKQARVIAIELHGTKKAIDTLLLPLGFKFVPLTKGYIYRKLLIQLIARPHVVTSIYKKLRQINPKIGSKMIGGRGPDIVSKDSSLVVGVYLR